jgi:hypothetical protein
MLSLACIVFGFCALLALLWSRVGRLFLGFTGLALTAVGVVVVPALLALTCVATPLEGRRAYTLEVELFAFAVSLFLLALWFLVPRLRRAHTLRGVSAGRPGRLLDGDVFLDEATGRALPIAGRPERIGAIAGPVLALGATVLHGDTPTYREAEPARLRATHLVAPPLFARRDEATEAVAFWVTWLGMGLGLVAVPALVLASALAYLRL